MSQNKDKSKDLKKDVQEEAKVEDTQANAEQGKEPSQEDIIKDLRKQVESLEEQRLMAVAESQNTLKRYQQETMNVRKYGAKELASAIIPAIDMFRSVLNTSPDIPEVKNYLIGFEMIINQIDNALSTNGITLIETKKGDDFNPEIHAAVEQVETDVVASGKIVSVISNGYKLYDRVIKHVNVKVAK